MFIKLLGPTGLVHHGDPNGASRCLGVGKPLVLLARLVVEPRGLPRQALAEFLWPEVDQHRARASARQALHVVRRALGEDALIETRERVSLAAHIASDWRQVQAAVERRDDGGIFTMYGGPFLENVPVLDVLDVDQWIEVERARLSRLFSRVATKEVQRLQQSGHIEQAITAARKLCQLHPTEPPHWGLLLGILHEAGDDLGFAEAYEGLALRVSSAAFNGLGKARELLVAYAGEAIEAGVRASSVLGITQTGIGDRDEGEEDGETVITLFRSPAFIAERATRQVLIGHLDASLPRHDEDELVVGLLNHCGIPVPASQDEWVPSLRSALESLRGVPHRIRLLAESPRDGTAVMAIREAARMSRGTCLHVEALIHPGVPRLIRTWQELITGTVR